MISLLWIIGIVHLRAQDLWHGVTYTMNYLPDGSWEVGHLWSLLVEEQSYLLWPFAFVSLGPRKASWAAAAVIVVAIFARLANRVLLIGTPYHDVPMFPMVADSLAMGCLLARLRKWLEQQRWYLRLFQPGWSILLLGLVLLLNRYEKYTAVTVVGGLLINAGLAILIHRSVYYAGDPAGRFLNWRPVAFIGVLSYSLYLWQQLFLDRYSSAWVSAFPQNLALVFGAAVMSYFIIEKPLFELRHRLRSRTVRGAGAA